MRKAKMLVEAMVMGVGAMVMAKVIVSNDMVLVTGIMILCLMMGRDR